MKVNVASTSEFASNPVGTMELQTMAKTAKSTNDVDAEPSAFTLSDISGNVTHLIAAELNPMVADGFGLYLNTKYFH
jgi:hypothetical protein